MSKKIVAPEWLYFIVFMFIGFVVLPLLLMITDPLWKVTEFYTALFNKGWSAWLFTIVPYLLFQLVRSIGWVIRNWTVRKIDNKI